MAVFRLKLFGNPENRKKKKKWEAEEGRRRYDNLTGTGHDEGGNKLPDSDLVKKNKEILKSSEVEARKAYRNIEHLNGNSRTMKNGVSSELYHGIRDEAIGKAKTQQPFEMFERVDRDVLKDEIGNISSRELKKATGQRRANHVLSQSHSKPTKSETILKPKKNITKQLGSILGKVGKRLKFA